VGVMNRTVPHARRRMETLRAVRARHHSRTAHSSAKTTGSHSGVSGGAGMSRETATVHSTAALCT